MHQMVLGTLPADERARVERRESAGEKLRTISTGIGGLDLGMSKSLAQAKRRGERLSFGGAGSSATGVVRLASHSERSRAAGAEDQAARARPVSARSGAEGGEPREDSPLISAIETPDHGLRGPGAKGTGKSAAAGSRTSPTGWLRKGGGGGAPAAAGRHAAWIESVTWPESPEPRARRFAIDGQGRATGFERLESGSFLRYRIEQSGSRATARPVADRVVTAGGEESSGQLWRSVAAPASDASPPALPTGLATLEILPATAGAEEADPAAGSRSASSGRDPTPEASSLRLRLRGIAGRDLEAAVPRPLLQRLVLGREADLAPERPLSGLSPAPKVLAGGSRVLVMASPALEAPPWAGPSLQRPGEEDPAVLARSLARWWASESQGGKAPTVAVGTDPLLSAGRWERAPQPAGRASLVLPEDAFPGAAKAARERVAEAWKGGEILASPPAAGGSPLVVLASAEAPALLGARLRRLARDPAMKGKLLAVWPLGGPVRSDLPSSLVAEGSLAGIGFAEYSPVGLLRAAAALAALRTRLADRASRDLRAEDLSDALLWYY